MKLYVQMGMAGVAGVVHFEDRQDRSAEGHSRRLRMQRLMTGEANAAIEGALEAGVDEILVNDAHGSGYNILFEELNPAAQIIHGPLTRQPCWTPCLDESVDFLFCLGQHAMAGTNGVLAHTLWYVNDFYFGDAGMCMALAGSLGVPAILVTGDDTVTRQARNLVPQVETVAVKHALSPYNARSWTPAKAREMIREAAARAIRRWTEIPPFTIKPPYQIGHPSRPGTPPRDLKRGSDLSQLLQRMLYHVYDYELQEQRVWPLEPGNSVPAIPKVLRKKMEREWERKRKDGAS